LTLLTNTRFVIIIIQQDLKSNNLSLNEAFDVAQNCPLWRLSDVYVLHYALIVVHARNDDGDGTFADNVMYVYTNLRLKLQSQFIVLASAVPPTSAVRNCHK